jgi:hypothetical protein
LSLGQGAGGQTETLGLRRAGTLTCLKALLRPGC